MRTGRPSAGFTLISMLVGLVIGILSIASMLVMYRVLIGTAYQVKTKAMTDGELATSSVASQEQLQQAGFGVTGAALGTDLVLLSNAALAGGKLSGTAATSYGSTLTGNAVIWGYNPTGASATFNAASYVCEGLIVTSSGLQWLSPVSCSNAAQWQSLSWQAPNQLASSGRSIGTTSNFVMAPATCWPYGQTTAISSVQVSYFLQPQSSAASSAPASASTASSAQFDAIPVFSVCLPNFNL
jgi:hypothetical protein